MRISKSDHKIHKKNDLLLGCPSNYKPFGITFAEWTRKWWEWLLFLDKSANPARDSSGIYFNGKLNQQPNVLFLYQTIEGTSPFPTRSIITEKGIWIFMPIINWLSIQFQDGITDEELISKANEKMDAIGSLKVLVNGNDVVRNIAEHRVKSDIFEITMPKNNILDLPPPRKRRVVSDGYWIFLGPICEKTLLSTIGSCSSGKTNIGVNYVIDVEMSHTC